MAVRIRHDDRDVLVPSDVGLRPEGDAYGPMIIEGSEAVASANDDEARHGELLVRARELNGGKRAFPLRLRAYNQGAAFRLEIPAEPREGEIRLSSEMTALRFPRDYACRGRDVSITVFRHRPSLVEFDRRAGIEVGFVPARQGAIVRLAEPGLRPLDTVSCSGKHTRLLLGRQHRLGQTLIALLNRASCAAADDSTTDRARPQARGRVNRFPIVTLVRN
ncbi:MULTISPECIES: glycoside hydrolase family 97 N-terminal domain-containing protein [Sphingomonas]|uniref:glycoside hydrolase family 97 N-terminal domain-containing protein n=1 Tax=Sphingomonas TaxID=13687 RepID=UPI0009EA2343|nr:MULTISPECIES: glycoside hydrolase family 97 N-terminal domain-containing protein [Sphingomonas]MDY0968135.1 glycoside hydrolase family 97 N-terminal domain-containing protein [Sphingomonas sp. CFBP9021]